VECIAWVALLVCILAGMGVFLPHDSIHGISSTKHCSHDKSVHSCSYTFVILCNSFFFSHLLFCILSCRFSAVYVFCSLILILKFLLHYSFLMDWIFYFCYFHSSDIYRRVNWWCSERNFIILVFVKLRFALYRVNGSTHTSNERQEILL